MFEQHRSQWLASMALPALFAAAGLWALMQLPPGARVPIHFDAAGQVDGWTDALWGLFAMPVIAVGLVALLGVLAAIDPRAEKLRQSRRAQLNIVLAAQLVLGAVQAVIIATALGHQPDVSRWLLVMVGLLFAVMGNMAGKLRWNYTIGIRTPWTLADERVWDKTHRFGGKLFFVGGLALMAAGLLALAPNHGRELILTVTLGAAALSAAKSWWLWRQMQPPGHGSGR